MERLPGLLAVGFDVEWLWHRLQLDLIEAGDAVGLGPQREFARSRKRLILGGEQLLPVETYGEAVPVNPEAKGMPFIRGDPQVSACDLLPAALDHAIEADVVLHRV